MAYTPGDENRYFKVIIAALIVLAGAIGWFVYSLLFTSPDDLSPVSIEFSEDGVPLVDPGGGSFPDSDPHVPEPTSPPPNS